jgi:hypothetical protein
LPFAEHYTSRPAPRGAACTLMTGAATIPRPGCDGRLPRYDARPLESAASRQKAPRRLSIVGPRIATAGSVFFTGLPRAGGRRLSSRLAAYLVLVVLSLTIVLAASGQFPAASSLAGARGAAHTPALITSNEAAATPTGYSGQPVDPPQDRSGRDPGKGGHPSPSSGKTQWADVTDPKNKTENLADFFVPLGGGGFRIDVRSRLEPVFAEVAEPADKILRPQLLARPPPA